MILEAKMNNIIRIILFVLMLFILSLISVNISNLFFYDRPIGNLLDFILFIVILIMSIHLSEHIFNIVKEMNMIRKLITIMIAIGLVGIGLNVFMPFLEEPPTPTVELKKAKVPVIKGSYCWDGIIHNQCVDRLYEDPLDMVKNHKPTVASPNEDINIGFRLGRTAETLKVEQWIDKDHVLDIDAENSSIMSPRESGIYVYHILASWEQGEGSYTFSIEVK